MPQLSKVGEGWSAEDRVSNWYSTLGDWLTAEIGNDYGGDLQAECKGACGPGAMPTSAPAGGHRWVAYASAGQYYNYQDMTSAAVVSIASISTPNGTMQGIGFTSNNGFRNSLESLADKVIIEDAFFIYTGTGSADHAIEITGSALLADRPIFRRCIAIVPPRNDGGAGNARHAFRCVSGHVLVENSILFSNTDDPIEASADAEFTNCYAFSTNNAGFPAVVTTTNCASDGVNSDIQNVTPSALQSVDTTSIATLQTSDFRTVDGGALDTTPLIGVALGPAAADLKIDDLVNAKAVFQRPETGGYQKQITVRVNADPAGDIEWRIVNHADDTEIQPWATLLTSPPVGVQTPTVTLPVNTGLFFQKIQVRWASNNLITAETTNPFAVGILCVEYGQSNALRRETVSNGAETISQFAAYNDGVNWAGFPVGAGAIAKVNQLINDFGLPVSYINEAVNSQSIAQLNSGSNLAVLLATIDAAGGDTEVVFFDQGERDGQLGTTTADYKTGLTTLYAAIQAHVGRAASNLALMVTLGGNSNGYTDYTDAKVNAIIQAKLEAASENEGIYLSGHRKDQPLADTIHNTADGFQIAGAREARSYAQVKGLSVDSGRGPHIKNIEVSGSDVIVTYDQNITKVGTGASTVTEISQDDFATTFTITDSVASTNTVTHSLSSTPSGEVSVRDWYGIDIPSTTYFTDASSDPVQIETVLSTAATSDLIISISGMPDGTYRTVLVDDASNIVFSQSIAYVSGSATASGLSLAIGANVEGYVIDNESPHVNGAVITGTTT